MGDVDQSHGNWWNGSVIKTDQENQEQFQSICAVIP